MVPDLPLIVGGGITNPEFASAAARSGADIVVCRNGHSKMILMRSTILFFP